MHNNTRAPLLLACLTALLAGVPGCDEGDDQPRSSRIVVQDLAAELDEADAATPAPIGQILACDLEDGDGDLCDDTTAKELTTICYCGYSPSTGPVYITVDCAGYPGTQVCCSDKCSTRAGGTPGQG